MCKRVRHFYLLRGLLLSTVHNKVMSGNPAKNRSGKLFYYYRAKGNGAEHNIPAAQLENEVADFLFSVRVVDLGELDVPEKLDLVLEVAPNLGVVYEALKTPQSRRQLLELTFNKGVISVDENGIVDVEVRPGLRFECKRRGTPIIGDDESVESGHCRIMALRRGADRYPDRFEDYRQRLSAIVEGRGVNPDRLNDYDQPVLVRRRVSDVDRAAFAEEANSAAILQMSETERARNDARRISPEALHVLEVGDDFDSSLRSSRNREFISSFVGQLPENDRAAMIDRDGDLTQSGIRRVKDALFNRMYDAPKLSDRLFESTDNDVKNVTNGLMGGLGRLAQAEELVRQGQRNEDLSIAPDIAIATEKLSSLKDQGMDIDTYLSQGQLFEREMSPVQEKILVAFNERRRSGKKVRELVSSWADYVEA